MRNFDYLQCVGWFSLMIITVYLMIGIVAAPQVIVIKQNALEVLENGQ